MSLFSLKRTKSETRNRKPTFGKHGKLSSNVTVADDTQCLSSNLPAALGDLVPHTLPHLSSSIGELSRETDDLGKNELGYRTRVGERRVEHGHTGRSGSLERYLVRSDTETSNDQELIKEVIGTTAISINTLFLLKNIGGADLGGSLEDLLSNLGFASDTDSVVIPKLCQELFLRPSLNVVIDLVALVLEVSDGVGRDVLQEENLDLFGAKGLQMPRGSVG